MIVDAAAQIRLRDRKCNTCLIHASLRRKRQATDRFRCGASLFVTAPEASAKLCSKILKDAEARGVDCIAVACPLCQSNLDTKQDEIRAKYGISRAVPVVFVTQLMGLAFGIEEEHLKFESSFVPFELKPAGATT